MPADRRPIAFGLVVLAAACFIVNAGVSRVVLRAGIDPATLTSLRLSGGVLVLAGWALLLHRPSLRFPTGRRLVLLVVLGVVGVAGLQWTYFVAIDLLPVGVALLLEHTAPVLVALYARVVCHEDVRPRVWAALGLALAGLALVARVWQGLTLDGVGVLAGFGAAICFATYFLLGESGVSVDEPLTVVLWAFVFGTVVMNLLRPATAVDADVFGSATSLLGALAAWTVPVWLLVGWIVVLGTVAPFAMEVYALRVLPATVVVPLAMLEPVGVSALGWAWFGESLGPVQVLGGLAVVTGILLASTARRRPVAEPPPLG